MKKWLKKEYTKVYIIGGIGLAVTIVGCVLLVHYWEYIQNFKNYGYPGVFLLTFVTGSGLPIPLPYIVVVFTLGAVLNPVLLGVASGAGAAIGQQILYSVGFIGRPFLTTKDPPTEGFRGKTYSRIPVWARRRTPLFVFLTNVIFNPLSAPITLGVSASGFPAWKFFLLTLAAHIIKSTIIAYLGYFGLGSVLGWFGVA